MLNVATISIKRTASVVFFLTLLAMVAYPAFAEESTATPSGATKKEATQQRIETKIESIKEKMATKEATLKLKLDAFKDRKKATAAARININLSRINENQTTQMQRHLDNMIFILNKLETRVNEGKSDIKDQANARTAIASARVALASASAAVTAQSQKDYIIQITTESRVKLDAMAQREQLFKDIHSLRRTVIEAKKAVINAIRTARAEKSEVSSEGKEATESGKR